MEVAGRLKRDLLDYRWLTSTTNTFGRWENSLKVRVIENHSKL